MTGSANKLLVWSRKSRSRVVNVSWGGHFLSGNISKWGSKCSNGTLQVGIQLVQMFLKTVLLGQLLRGSVVLGLGHPGLDRQIVLKSSKEAVVFSGITILRFTLDKPVMVSKCTESLE